jgi:hypothetical protein
MREMISRIFCGAPWIDTQWPTYHRLRAQRRGPVEMRRGLNAIRITAEAERDWQRRVQEPSEDFKTRPVERAVKAGDAAAKSSKHVSKQRRAARCPPPPAVHPRAPFQDPQQPFLARISHTSYE